MHENDGFEEDVESDLEHEFIPLISSEDEEAMHREVVPEALPILSLRHTVLFPGVVIYENCLLGDRVRIHANSVVGADGFGYEFVRGRHEKVPQVGGVILESDVEIGANATTDRARFSQTVIGEGTKIDNLVQVAHNVVIGKHCILCAQVGIAGSTTLGDYVVLGLDSRSSSDSAVLVMFMVVFS